MSARTPNQANKANKGGDFYTQAGVNVDLGDLLSSIAGAECKKSYDYCPFLEIDDGRAGGRFRGPVGFRLKGLPSDTYYTAGADGIGTKVMLYILLKKMGMRNAARDLLAMILDDIVRYGNLPLAVGNVLDVSTLGENKRDSVFMQFVELMRGLGDAARDQNVTIIAGETAELGPFVGSENQKQKNKFNWAGFAVGAMRRRMRILGDKIRPGQPIVALHEPGMRSNGFSAFRKFMRELFGLEWWNEVEAQDLIEMAGLPSVIYASLIAEANGWLNPEFEPIAEMTGIAHITGGGILGKFGDDLIGLTGYSAELTSLYDPPALVERMVRHFKSQPGAKSVWTPLVPYSKFCCGQGMLVVLSNDDEMSKFLQLAEQRGYEAKEAGRIIKTRRSSRQILKIKSGFNSKTYSHPIKVAV